MSHLQVVMAEFCTASASNTRGQPQVLPLKRLASQDRVLFAMTSHFHPWLDLRNKCALVGRTVLLLPGHQQVTSDLWDAEDHFCREFS